MTGDSDGLQFSTVGFASKFADGFDEEIATSSPTECSLRILRD